MNGWVRYWAKCRTKLKEEFEIRGIMRCEVALPGCFRDNFLSFAHLHKRDWYKTRGNEELLGSFDQVLLACIPCHNKLEDDKELTKKYFDKLRNT